MVAKAYTKAVYVVLFIIFKERFYSMKDTTQKEGYILVYNNDFNEVYENHLTPMDAYVYVTMKLMAGNPHFFGRLYATADSICSFSFDIGLSDVSQSFIRELRLSMKRISENGYIPYELNNDKKPIRHVYTIGAVWEKDSKAKDNWKNERYTPIPISACKKIFSAFGLSEMMKVRVLYFYIKLSSLISYKTGICTYSLDTIAEKTNLSVRTVQDYIRVLETYKVLAVYHMGENIKRYANYPANVLGQYYNKERVLLSGQASYEDFCSKYRLDKNGNKKSKQASA